MSRDPFDLDRLVNAQETSFDAALAELAAGRKRSHWMWFVFPQLRGLGRSSTALFFGIASREEAAAYLDHAVLGSRLVQSTLAVLAVRGRSLHEIFGSPDDLKFASSMTLFEAVGGARHAPFGEALDRYCAGRRDPQTLTLLSSNPGSSGPRLP